MHQYSESSNQELLEFWFQGHQIRAIVRSSKMWFVAQDIAAILGASTQQLLQMLPLEDTGHHAFSKSAIKGKPILSEAGLVRVAMTRKGVKAAELASWLMNEFLPQMVKITHAGRGNPINSLVQQVALLSLHVTSLNRRVAKLERPSVAQMPVRRQTPKLVVVSGDQAQN